MKTQGMSQQLEALRRMNGREYFALFMEQGTGKTWSLLADAERLYAAGKIDSVFVLAPNGVHTNWVLREIPTHLDVPNISRAWRSGMGKRARAKVEEVLKMRDVGEVPPLRILTMSYDAVVTKDGFAFALQFLRSTKALFILDESSAIKNHTTVRAKKVRLLKPMSRARRIADGTPITQAPMDAFNPMDFLESGLLGTTSYRAFVAEFAELLPVSGRHLLGIVGRNPELLKRIEALRPKEGPLAGLSLADQLKADADLAERVAKITPQIVRRDEANNPVYRNLEKLQRLLAPHSFRVLKSECLDLPEKIYTQVFFDMNPKQRAAYEFLENDLRIQMHNGEIETVSALASLMKLQQITSGYVNVNGEPMLVTEDNPRLAALMTAVEGCHSKFIIWARFREEIAMICAALRAEGIEVVEYHGGVNAADREIAIDSFQNGTARGFVANQQAGGTGLTLTAAEDVIYCSNSYNLRDRLQSEDRCHRIGTRHPVRYIDLVAAGTIDESIAQALQRKTSVAAQILNDRNLAFRF